MIEEKLSKKQLKNQDRKYRNHLQNGIVSVNMFCNCLFTIDANAKECRNKMKKYKNGLNATNNIAYKQLEKEQAYWYQIKDRLLKNLKPTCIHRKQVETFKMVYKSDSEYMHIYNTDRKAIHSQGQDKQTGEWYINVVDRGNPTYEYFLYYQVGKVNYHTPISKDEIRAKYHDLNVFDMYGREKGVCNSGVHLKRDTLNKIIEDLLNNRLDMSRIIQSNNDRVIPGLALYYESTMRLPEKFDYDAYDFSFKTYLKRLIKSVEKKIGKYLYIPVQAPKLRLSN